jgi:hypothetical protein
VICKGGVVEREKTVGFLLIPMIQKIMRETKMIIEIGEKVHVVYRALYEKSNRRHFLGEVKKAEGTACRIVGNVFVMILNQRCLLKKKR